MKTVYLHLMDAIPVPTPSSRDPDVSKDVAARNNFGHDELRSKLKLVCIAFQFARIVSYYTE